MPNPSPLPRPPLRPELGAIDHASLFLDFDGTLVELAPRPDAIRVPAALPGLLLRIAGQLCGALAIVSGRPLRDLDRYLPVPIAMAGDHGAAMRPDPAAPPLHQDLPVPPAQWLARARPWVAQFPGALIEEKRHGFVLHFREAPPAAGDAARALLEHLVGESDGQFDMLQASMAWEVRPRGPSKATVVRALMARSPFAGRVPVFIGDDVTDEEGMAAARALGGHGWRLQDAFGTPAALRAWLAAAAGEAGPRSTP
jgi:trehalose 6-phosphate phosphatase